jgi:hypothetical protein
LFNRWLFVFHLQVAVLNELATVFAGFSLVSVQINNQREIGLWTIHWREGSAADAHTHLPVRGAATYQHNTFH